MLREGGEEAKVIAGGQSLIPMLTLRLATPRLLVDVLPADRPRVERQNGSLLVSAVTRHADLEADPLVAEHCPLLAQAASLVGNVRVRHRGTIGGSLSHADPAAELPCAALALGATIRALGPEGERRIAASDFFESFFTTALRPDEVVTAIELPIPDPGWGWSFRELKLRSSDFAVVAVAALVDLDRYARCAAVRLAAAGVGERPVDLSEAAEVLVGEVLDERAATEAGRRAASSAEPSAHVHVSAEYRRDMLAVFVGRALLQAAERARGGAA